MNQPANDPGPTLVLSRPPSAGSSSRAPTLAFVGGVLGLSAGAAWALSFSAEGLDVEHLVFAGLLLTAVGLGLVAKRWGPAAAASPAAACGITLAVIAGFAVDLPIETMEWVGLAGIGLEFAAAGASWMWARPRREGLPNVLAELVGKAWVLESSGVQWVLFLPKSPLQPEHEGQDRALLYLENCHDAKRDVELDLRQIGTPLIGGRDVLHPARCEVDLPALGFAQVELPIRLGPREREQIIDLVVTVRARAPESEGERRRRWRAEAPVTHPFLGARFSAGRAVVECFRYKVAASEDGSEAREGEAAELDEEVLRRGVEGLAAS